ncbi:MAG: ribosome-associated translation inhibitor RaiA [Bacilli bacterium]|jgi:putative sigma-54 modulation protein|nr:ribosome-associated translation inhibitor RaiA [Bacilli bacterium]
MKFQYVCKDVSLTPSMKQACEEKLGRFEHYFRAKEGIVCSIRIAIVKDEKSVEAAISADGFTLRAKTLNEDFYNAIDVLAEKLEGQMRKAKTQLAKAKRSNSLSENIQLEQIADDKEDEAAFQIVKRKTLSLTPMDVDEALARMDALGHSFFIYLDSSTGLVNVLYEREDHGYGVIEIEK